jgi:radical SAM protein with 4Fe4S-binding SPASM domain
MIQHRSQGNERSSDDISENHRIEISGQINRLKNDSLAKNILRKSEYIDEVKFGDKVPLFSYIEINPTELCNRKCVFCPRIDDNGYPNQNLHISIELSKKIAKELHDMHFDGGLAFSGYGEPLLTRNFVEIVRCFKQDRYRVEIITNGDHLTEQSTSDLISAGVTTFIVSMYDGPHQVDQFKKLFSSVGLDDSRYILRDRWHSVDDEFGLKLTNRAGTISFLSGSKNLSVNPCYYPSYSMLIDWNGDVFLCPQDWQKKVKFGNVHNERLLDVWKSSALSKRRTLLIRGARTNSPCRECDANGCIHGFNHAIAWLEPGN